MAKSCRQGSQIKKEGFTVFLCFPFPNFSRHRPCYGAIINRTPKLQTRLAKGSFINQGLSLYDLLIDQQRTGRMLAWQHPQRPSPEREGAVDVLCALVVVPYPILREVHLQVVIIVGGSYVQNCIGFFSMQRLTPDITPSTETRGNHQVSLPITPKAPPPEQALGLCKSRMCLAATHTWS